ncbi:MAG: transposase [Patescibacteria group bacterium]
MALFRDRYRVETARLVGRDYAEAGMYFVTVCTQGRYPWFGEIRNGVMGLSDAGCIVAQEIARTSCMRTNIVLDEWVVMPNHIHAIIEICPWNNVDPVMKCRRDVSADIAILIPLCRPRPSSLGSIVGNIKSASTSRIWAAGQSDFGWQTRFHDHIIRSDRALENIRSYIRNNPRTWERDRNYVH